MSESLQEGSIQSIDDIDTIVDTDVHTTGGLTLEDLKKYLSDPFDKMIKPTPSKYSDGFTISAGYVRPTDYGNVESRELNTPAHIKEMIEEFGSDRVIINGGQLSLGTIHYDELATAMASAYNDWLLDTLLDEVSNCYGSAMVAPQEPERAAEEIDRVKKEDSIVAIFVPSGGVTPPLGREQYFPIYEAAEKAELPIVLHGGVTNYMMSFSKHWEGTKRLIDMHTVAHPAEHMFHLSTMLTNGVPVRFPELNFAILETGLGWIPFFLHRYDNEYSEKRLDAPLLEKAPSEYVYDQFRFGSQPIEGADNPRYVQQIVRFFKGEKTLMFSSDYPHLDFDHPNELLKVLGSEFSSEEIENIYGNNALDIYNF